MVGIHTPLTTDRKPVVLWTPWGAIPKAPLRLRSRTQAKLHNAIGPRRPVDKSPNRKPS